MPDSWSFFFSAATIRQMSITLKYAADEQACFTQRRVNLHIELLVYFLGVEHSQSAYISSYFWPVVIFRTVVSFFKWIKRNKKYWSIFGWITF